MTTITTRSGKGSPLTNNEVDANFTNLNDDKVETSGDSMTGDLSFGDNDKAIFGAGSDLQIYHDGSNSYINDTSGTGNLYLASNQLIINNAANTENMARFAENGAATLYYDGSAKIATASSGIDVTGSVVSDGLTVDASTAVVQASNAGGTTSFEISNTNGVSTANNKATLYLSATGAEANAARIESDFTGTVATNHAQDLKFYYVGVSSAPTLGMTLNSSGIDVTGNIAVSSAGVRRIDISNTSLADTGEMASLQWDANADLTFQGRASDGTFKANWYRIEASASDGLADAHRFYTDSSVERMNITSTGIDVTGTVTADDITLSDTDTPTLTLTDTTNTVTNIVKANNSIGTVGTSTANDLYIQSNDTVRQRVRSNGDISFYNDSASSQAFYWDASESRLGLGTTSPSTTLDVAGTVTANNLTLSDSFPVLKIEDSDGTNQNLEIVSSSGASFITARNGSSNGTINLRRTDGTTTSRTMQVTAAGDVALYADDGTTQGLYWDASTSRLAIGRTNPAEELHIDASIPTIRLQDSDGTDQYANIYQSGGTTNIYTRNGTDYGDFYIRRYNGTDLDISFRVQNNGDIIFYGDDGSTQGVKFDASTNRLGIGTTSPSALLHLKSNAPYITFEDDDNNQDWQIQATAWFAIRDQSADQERMRIDSSGRVQVAKTSQVYTTVGVQLGTYSSNSIDNTTQFTHNNSGGTSVACTAPVSESCITFHRQDTGAFMGHIRNDSSNSVSYFTSSDERLKENIVDAPSASDDIDAIQVRSFDWKADGSHQKYGVIAQELNNVIPSAVDMTQDENRHASVDLSKLVPMLVKEIQSLRARVAQLETN